MQKGSLIVLEGNDGSGKTTQLELLVSYCQKHHLPHKTFDFPRYYDSFFGEMVGKFLKGDFGDINKIPPEFIALPYALDRWKAKDEIYAALESGKTVFINRYVLSNAAYQSAKLPEDKREDFVQWLMQMEYHVFCVPKEDVLLYLDVAQNVAQELVSQKKPRAYLGDEGKDLYEKNTELLIEVEKQYQHFCKTLPYCVRIDCMSGKHILPEKEIHEKIVNVLIEKNVFASSQ